MPSQHRRRFFAILLGLALVASCSRRVEEIHVVDRAKIDAHPLPQIPAGEWPWWRGPGSDGRAVGPAPPLQWSETKNVLWKAAVPGRGHATPIVADGGVYVATADEDEQTMSLLCYDQSTGDRRWACEIHRGGFMHTHSKNSHASSTPAYDGERIFCLFMVEKGVWASAVDKQGEIVWRTKAGAFTSKHGYGSSPVLYQSLVIVQGDNSGGGFLAGLDRLTGEIVWRVARGNSASFATPALARIGGQDQLLLSGQDKVVSHDPASGEILWQSDGPATTTANTIAWNDSLVFASGGFPQTNVLALKTDGDHQVVWSIRQKVYVPSLLLIDDKLLIVQDNGVARLLNASDGAEIWRKRLGGDFSASPVSAGDYVFATNERGKTFVFRVAPRFEMMAENELGTSGFASPVICGRRLYLRTEDHLYCIGES